MNEKDIHDLEKLEQIYEQQVIEEGLFSRMGAGLRANAQTVGAWGKGVGKALIGRGIELNAADHKILYKVANLVHLFYEDMYLLAGKKTDEDEASIVIETLKNMSSADSTSPRGHKESAKKWIDRYYKKSRSGARPRGAKAFVKWLTK